MLEADYETASLSNEDGELCGTYPHEIFILESEKGMRWGEATGGRGGWEV